jgi:hypothetical protein
MFISLSKKEISKLKLFLKSTRLNAKDIQIYNSILKKLNKPIKKCPFIHNNNQCINNKFKHDEIEIQLKQSEVAVVSSTPRLLDKSKSKKMKISNGGLEYLKINPHLISEKVVMGINTKQKSTTTKDKFKYLDNNNKNNNNDNLREFDDIDNYNNDDLSKFDDIDNYNNDDLRDNNSDENSLREINNIDDSNANNNNDLKKLKNTDDDELKEINSIDINNDESKDNDDSLKGDSIDINNDESKDNDDSYLIKLREIIKNPPHEEFTKAIELIDDNEDDGKLSNVGDSDVNNDEELSDIKNSDIDQSVVNEDVNQIKPDSEKIDLRDIVFNNFIKEKLKERNKSSENIMTDRIDINDNVNMKKKLNENEDNNIIIENQDNFNAKENQDQEKEEIDDVTTTIVENQDNLNAMINQSNNTTKSSDLKNFFNKTNSLLKYKKEEYF